jgi:hypothetical protein
MKQKQIWAGAVLALALGGCASTPSTRITTLLAGSDFNSISSQYTTRPTEVLLLEGSTSKTLLIEMEAYNTYNPTLGLHQPYRVPFEDKYVGDYLPLIDKYFEWEAQAISRGDALEKEIGRAKTSSGFGSGGAELIFTFYSGSSSRHHLVVEQCLATCLEPINFDRANVIELRRLLVALQKNELQMLDVDNIYQ